jgi:DNA modification methylase
VAKEKQSVVMEPAKKTDPRNTLNDLTNAQWMFFSRTAWITTYPNDIGFELRKGQGGNKPPRMMADLINFFTKPHQKVLDPMSGVGATLLGCALTDRQGTGVELNQEWIDIYYKVCKIEALKKFPVSAGDCLKVLDHFKPESFDFAAIDPPYREDTKWDRTMCNNTHTTRIANVPERYSGREEDFGNAKNYSEFLERIFLMAQKVKRVLKPEKYFVVFSKDEYQNGEFREKSSNIAEVIRKAGFEWKGKITWYQAGAKLRPYGVPYSYVPNITDQKILIFKNSPEESEKA